MGWQDHVQAVKRQHAELALAHILSSRAYPSGHQYTGSADGLQCQVIVSATPFHTMEDPTVGATVTGIFTLTYTGPRPAAITFYTSVASRGPPIRANVCSSQRRGIQPQSR